MRRCPRCKQDKPETQFYGKSGHWEAYCLDCNRQIGVEYYRTLPGRMSALARKARRYTEDSDVTQKFLTKLYEQQEGLCHYTGVQLSTEVIPGKRNPSGISLDRVDASRGYYQDNVALCCWIVNAMKRALSVEEFISLCREVIQHYDATQ